MVSTAERSHRRTASIALSFRTVGPELVETPEVEKVSQSNREWEAVLWIFEQSTACRVKKVGVLLLFPEDFGGHVNSGRASPWSAREVHNLECASDVQRCSAFLCQLDWNRPDTSGWDSHESTAAQEQAPLAVAQSGQEW